jgi:hypothetical protein
LKNARGASEWLEQFKNNFFLFYGGSFGQSSMKMSEDRDKKQIEQ